MFKVPGPGRRAIPGRAPALAPCRLECRPGIAAVRRPRDSPPPPPPPRCAGLAGVQVWSQLSVASRLGVRRPVPAPPATRSPRTVTGTITGTCQCLGRLRPTRRPRGRVTGTESGSESVSESAALARTRDRRYAAAVRPGTPAAAVTRTRALGPDQRPTRRRDSGSRLRTGTLSSTSSLAVSASGHWHCHRDGS
jgi:hypothetical protein